MVAEIELQRYRDWAPMVGDPPGLYSDNREDWFALCSRCRDSQALGESNFDACLELLGGESDTVVVHRFNHWGPGWVEIIIAHPSREEDVLAIAERLTDSPVLDEEDLSRRESEATAELWDNMGMGDRMDLLKKHGESIFAARAEGTELYDRAPETYYEVQVLAIE